MARSKGQQRKSAGKKSTKTNGLVWPFQQQNLQDVHALALQFQLQESEWWSPEKLLNHQLHQIQQLINHAAKHVPYYRERLKSFADLPPRALSMERFREIPLLKRSDIQGSTRLLRSRALPKSHGAPSPSKTSGSTGRPLEFLTTAITGRMNIALTMRGHLWHQRDFNEKNVTLRLPLPGMPVDQALRWAAVAHTGPGLIIDTRLPISEMFAAIVAENPAYLQSHPQVIYGLLRHSEETGIRFENLREIRTYGETLGPLGARKMRCFVGKYLSTTTIQQRNSAQSRINVQLQTLCISSLKMCWLKCWMKMISPARPVFRDAQSSLR